MPASDGLEDGRLAASDSSVRDHLRAAAVNGAKFFGVCVSFFLTVYSIDALVPQYNLPSSALAYALAFGVLPLFALLAGVIASLQASLRITHRGLVEARTVVIDELKTTSVLQLEPAILKKIERLNWEALSPEERAEAYDSYLALKPRAHSGRYRTASPERQLELQNANPVDAGPLNRFLESLGLPQCPSIPMSDADNTTFQQRRASIIESVVNMVDDGFDDEQAECFKRLYDYVSCAELQTTQHEDVDVCIVPGARWSLQQRVDRALQVRLVSGCQLLLVGGHPAYDRDYRCLIAESEAMLHYLQTKPNLTLNTEDVHIETRSTTSMESLVHCLPWLNSLAFDRGRALNVGLVTSTYHARRFFLQAQQVFGAHQSVVESCRPITTPATIDLHDLLRAPHERQERAQTVLRTFVSESLKLLGGRAIGEY